MVNKIILMGRLVRDPELRQTQSGISVCRFTVAVDRYAKQGEEKQADFLDVTAWRQTADFVSRYFSKGRMIYVEGSIHNDNYTDQNGNKVYRNTINAERVDFCGDKPQTQQAAKPAQPARYATAAPQQARTAVQQPASAADDLSSFSEIISDGEPPF